MYYSLNQHFYSVESPCINTQNAYRSTMLISPSNNGNKQYPTTERCFRSLIDLEKNEIQGLSLMEMFKLSSGVPCMIPSCGTNNYY